MGKLIKPKAKAEKSVEKEVQEVELTGVIATGSGYKAVYGGVTESYEGNDAFAVAVKRFKIMRGF